MGDVETKIFRMRKGGGRGEVRIMRGDVFVCRELFMGDREGV